MARDGTEAIFHSDAESRAVQIDACAVDHILQGVSPRHRCTILEPLNSVRVAAAHGAGEGSLHADLDQLMERLRDKFQRETNLTLLTKGGDLQIEGSITGYRTSPVAIQADETAAMNRLTISVNVVFTNTQDDSQSFTSSFSRYQDYSSSQNLNEVQETLIDIINEMMSRLTQFTQGRFC